MATKVIGNVYRFQQTTFSNYELKVMSGRQVFLFSLWSNSFRRRASVSLMLGILLAIGFCNPQTSFAQSNEPTPAETVSDDTEESATSSADEKAISQNPLSAVFAMGYFIIPFVLASVIALWFTIERLVILRRGRVIPKHFVFRFLEHLQQRQLDQENALKLCEEKGSPVAQIFAHGIRKWGKPSVEVEQAIIDGGERQVGQLRKHLRIINGVATVSPLIGLLGTVIGMIVAFNKIADSQAMGKPEELAVGIALALFTTAAGLMIAIPSLIIYMYLAGRVDSLVMEMDELAQSVVMSVSAEALAQKPSSPPPPRQRSTTARRSKKTADSSS